MNETCYIFFISTYEILELLPLFSFWMLWDQVTVVVLQSHLGLCGFIPGVATEMRSFHIARRGCRSGPLASTYCRRWCCYASLRWAQNTWNSKNKTLVYIYNKLTRRMIHGVRSRNEQWTNIQGVSYWYIRGLPINRLIGLSRSFSLIGLGFGDLIFRTKYLA